MATPDRVERRRAHRSAACAAALALTVAAAAAPAFARDPEPPETVPRAGEGLTFIDHGRTAPFWLGAEVNSILQMKPSFPAAYSGANSLRPEREAALSGLMTVFLAWTPFATTELILDPEMALGGGLSSALGVAGFTNLDVVRNPTLSHAPYIARAQIHQIIPLSRRWVANEDRGPISSMATVPEHRIELRAGKLSTADLFDINPAGSDSHLQFMNWTVDNNGAYDYAADTRGYTWGALVEYQGPRFEVRFGEMLMPKVANGVDLDFDPRRAHAENVELEIKYSRAPDWAGTLRPLLFVNHANMGSYRDAIDAFMTSSEARPDVTAHRAQGRVKVGVGLNLVQELRGVARAFARAGWNDGRNESFAYTEVDDTLELGADLRGVSWRRPDDKIGLALVSNGISDVHREYLRLGGRGFLLGDGGLSYGREGIVESYYNAHVWRGASLAVDVQLVRNPGYNGARGPVEVFSLRAHLEL